MPEGRQPSGGGCDDSAAPCVEDHQFHEVDDVHQPRNPVAMVDPLQHEGVYAFHQRAAEEFLGLASGRLGVVNPTPRN